MDVLTIVATGVEAEAEKTGLFQALGLDVTQLLINAVAFLVLLAILARFVYPVLIKSIDARREAIEAGLEEAKKTQAASQEAEQRIEEMLAGARKEADEILARSHSEAQAMVSDAETKAKDRADKIVADARVQLTAEVTKAREGLKKDAFKLVALATEKVIDQKLDDAKDVKLVEAALAQETPAAKGRRA